MVADDEPEGTHYFHSHGDDREQTGARALRRRHRRAKGRALARPRHRRRRCACGWDAIIQPPSGSAFREFALYYHEIGDENYQIARRATASSCRRSIHLPTAYRPDGRALNYRSEPFMNRLQLQQSLTGNFDESRRTARTHLAIPPTPIMRSYLGDPVKQRVIHGGSEVFHVHHVHGGAIRWRKQPGVESADVRRRPRQAPAADAPTRPSASTRRAIGPSETFDIEDECGSGGCQQSVGDFLIHCHVAAALLRRHVDDLAGLQHAAGRRRVHRRAAAAA